MLFLLKKAIDTIASYAERKNITTGIVYKNGLQKKTITTGIVSQWFGQFFKMLCDIKIITYLNLKFFNFLVPKRSLGRNEKTICVLQRGALREGIPKRSLGTRKKIEYKQSLSF